MSFQLSSWLRMPPLLRSLRMRLTVSYVIFFALVLAGAGILFERALDSMLQRQSRLMLEQEWGDVLACLNLDTNPPTWPRADTPEQREVIARVRRYIRIESLDGRVWELSPGFRQLTDYTIADHDEGLAAPSPVLKRMRGPHGESCMVLMGRARHQGKEFYLAVGVPVRGMLDILQGFVRTYFLSLPAVLLIIGFLGWLLARRALEPVKELAAAASAVSGGNLDLRLAGHDTGDELDVLIRTFNNMLERLEQSFVQMSQFSLDASHELRTPLTAARGQLEVALLSAGTVEEYREAIAVAVQELERLSQLVDSLLLLAQAESGQLKLQLKRHNLAALVENVLSQYHVVAVEQGVRLESEMPRSDCFALVDRLEFERMLSNLVSNAVRCTPAGGVVRVELAYGAGTPGDIRLSVRDTGPGIAPEHQAHIFDPLYRVREGQRSSASGLGLGLSFALWAAQAHGGRIELKSIPGQGATFTIVLPAAALAEAPAQSDEPAAEPTAVKEAQS
jgi:heavy metal sensor kinase